MLSGGAGKKKEIIIDSKAIKESTKEAKALLKKIAGEIIPAVIKQELKSEKYKGDKGDQGENGDSIVGPKGDQGPRGDQGPQGLNGSNGKDGVGKDGIDGKDGKDSPFCEFFCIKPIKETVRGDSASEVFKATIENETLNAIEVKVDITAEDSKKTAYVFLDRKYRFVCRLGKYELIGKPKDESVSNNSKLLSKFNLEIRNNDIKILAPGLENEAVNYYGSVSINGGTFKS